MDTTTKLRPSSRAPPDSEVPTLAPSRTSVSDDGKPSLPPSAAGEQTDVDMVSAKETHIHHETHAEEQDAAHHHSNEKPGQDGLARHATAASRTGTNLEQAPTREDGSEYPKGMTLGLIVLALCLSVFTMALDNSIIATAIPKITDQFHSLPDVGWYASGE